MKFFSLKCPPENNFFSLKCPMPVCYVHRYTTKTGRHDIAEILLKVALKHQKASSITQSINQLINQN
jgi:hypothetical protein